MPGRDAASLVGVWERGIDQPPVRRALLLLDSATDPATATPDDDPAALAIGVRDARLLALRADLFGPVIEAVARCPECGQDVEFELSGSDLGAEPSPDTGALRVEGTTVTVRPVTSADILAVAQLPIEEASRALAGRCVVDARAADGSVARPETLSETAVSRVSEELARLDPGARIDLALACPECGSDWVAPFDVVGFLWKELDSWARRTLADVHTLARSYGWAERDILALHPQRRRHYLELVRA